MLILSLNCTRTICKLSKYPKMMHPTRYPKDVQTAAWMIQTEDQSFRLVREPVTRDWLTHGNLHLCREQQAELLRWVFSAGYTRTQLALSETCTLDKDEGTRWTWEPRDKKIQCRILKT